MEFQSTFAASSLLASLSDKVELGWLAIYVPVAGALVWRIVRGLRAERYAEKSLGTDITTIRDAYLDNEITPTLARVAVSVREYMKTFEEVAYLPGEAGDPQNEAERILGYRAPAFSDALKELQANYSTVAIATRTHDRKVAECQRSAWAFFILLGAWTYLGCAVAIKENDLPLWSIFCAVAGGCVAFGWAAAEWWAGNQETNALSKLVRAANQVPSGGTN